MIDVNASLGHWPFGLLRGNTPAGLLRLLGSAGIRQACVAPLEGLLYHDIQVANRRMHRAVARHRGQLLPLSVINPAFPGWRDDLAECRRDLRTAGVRLFPGYHGYRIDEECCGQLFAELERARLPVQIAPVVADPRMHHPRVHVPAADLSALHEELRRFRTLRVLLLNVRENDPALREAALFRSHANLFTDIAWVDGVARVEELVDRLGIDRVVLGTNAPLMLPLSAIYKLRECDLTRRQRERLTRTNALRWLGRRAIEGGLDA